jgi:hypothetical protein
MRKIYLKAEMRCINREVTNKNVAVAVPSQPLKNTKSCISNENEHEVTHYHVWQTRKVS